MRRPLGRIALDDDESEINITPMLDVVFIMLIFFIVTATFVKERGIDVNQPDDNKLIVKTEADNILIRIDADNNIWLGQRNIDIRSVRANIERLHAENSKALVVIQTANKSKTDVMIAIMDASLQAKVPFALVR
jgi:biopolymer transport protein ExbD